MRQSDQAAAHNEIHSVGLESNLIRPEDFEWIVSNESACKSVLLSALCLCWDSSTEKPC